MSVHRGRDGGGPGEKGGDPVTGDPAGALNVPEPPPVGALLLRPGGPFDMSHAAGGDGIPPGSSGRSAIGPGTSGSVATTLPAAPLPRIEAVEVREIHLQLKEPFRISSGTQSHRRILLVRLCGEGAEGWGECVAGEEPNYSAETTDTAWLAIAGLPPLPAVPAGARRRRGPAEGARGVPALLEGVRG